MNVIGSLVAGPREGSKTYYLGKPPACPQIYDRRGRDSSQIAAANPAQGLGRAQTYYSWVFLGQAREGKSVEQAAVSNGDKIAIGGTHLTTVWTVMTSRLSSTVT